MPDYSNDEVALFTDACCADSICTGCTVLTGPGVRLRFIVQHYPSCDSPLETEIYSAITALTRAPKDRPLVLYVDLDLITTQYRRARHKRRHPSLALFDFVAAQFPRLRVVRVDRGHSYYKECHCYAKALARGIRRHRRYEQLAIQDLLPRPGRLSTLVRRTSFQFHARKELRRQQPAAAARQPQVSGWRRNWPDG